MTGDFLWGASSSAHQTEGNNLNSDSWANEHRMSFMAKSGDAIDSYHRYPEDMKILADAGLNTYRFGIEWARIEPAPGEFSRAMLAHYRRMIDTAKDLGLTPVVTLHHFSNPRWFTEEGGWMGPTGRDRFVAYVARASEILGDIEWIATINEPNIFALMTSMAASSDTPFREPGHEIPLVLPRPSIEVGEKLIDIHKAAVEELRKNTDAKIGWTVAGQAYWSKPENRERLLEEQWAREDLYLRASRGDDWVGVQSYHTQEIGPEGPVPHPDLPGNTQSGPFTPEALEICIRHAWELSEGTPILVTENGVATEDDERRIEFIEGAVAGLQSAQADGVDVRGYLHWTLLDNFEWAHWDTSFGLIAVDRETFARTPKPSIGWFGDFARRQQA